MNENWKIDFTACWGVGVRLSPHIILDPKLVKQFRFPRSKKKRIRKKWAKRIENFRPDETVYYFQKAETIVCHPSVKVALDGYFWRKGYVHQFPMVTS